MSDKKETASLKGGLTFSTSIHPYDAYGKKPRKADVDLYGEGLLGESLAPKRSGELSTRFMVPPFTVLNAREGWWQDRKRAWLALGIQSELGRGGEEALGAHSLPVAGGRGTAMANAIANKAAPGGAAMPAMNYKNRESGAGTGTAIAGTSANKPEPKPKPAVPAPAKKFAMPSITKVERSEPQPRSATTAARLQAPLALPQSAWTPPADLPSLKGASRIAIDVETCDPDLSDLGPGVRRGAYIAGIAVGIDGGPRWYFPMRHEGGGNLPADSVLGWARKDLNDFDGEIVGAHLIYDLDFLAQEGITFPKVKRFRDIQLAEPLLDEHRFTYGLDALAKDYLNESKDDALLYAAAASYGLKKPTDKAVKGLIWRLPASLVGAYAEADVDLPLRTLVEQEKKLQAEDLTELFDLECRLIPMVLAMQRRGVRINEERIESVRAALDEEREGHIRKLRECAGQRAELMAPGSFAHALEDRGIEVPLTLSTRKPSITKGFLEQHAGDEMVDAIIAGRKINTIINTFIDGLSRHAVGGRVHCTFNQLKSDDGGTIARFSASSPNLQNIPARDERLGPLVRSLFEPEPGEVWEKDDYSQIEYRLLAHYAVGKGANECRQKYNEDPDTDYHKLCAEFMGVDPEDKVGRRRVKGVNFAKGYGARTRKIAQLLGTSEEEALRFIRRYETALPFTVETFERADRRAQQNGHIITLLKRRMRFPLWEPRRSFGHNRRPGVPKERALIEYGENIQRANTYMALNRLLQGGAADLLKKAMVDIWEAGLCDVLGAPLVTVHDELDWSVPQTTAGEEAIAEARNLMEKAITLRVPVKVDFARGANWGETG